MCDCSKDLEAIKKSQATLAFSLMQITEALVALCDREANARRIEESARKLRANVPSLQAIVHGSGVDPHEEDTRPDHPIPRRDASDTDPAPALDPSEA